MELRTLSQSISQNLTDFLITISLFWHRQDLHSEKKTNIHSLALLFLEYWDVFQKFWSHLVSYHCVLWNFHSVLRPKDPRNFVFFQNSCIVFNKYYFFHLLVPFQWSLVFQKDLLSVILFTLRLLIKFLFVFLISMAQKLRYLLYTISLINESSLIKLLRRWIWTIINFRTLLFMKGAWLCQIFFSFIGAWDSSKLFIRNLNLSVSFVNVIKVF